MHELLTALALLVQITSQGSAPAAPFAAARGTFFALSVADLDASTRWYSEKFGLTVVMRSARQDKASAVVLDGGGLTVELIKHDDAIDAPKEAPLVHGLVKVGVVVDDLDQALATLKARGVPVFLGPYPARGNSRSNAIIKDNAGTLIQLFGR